MILTTEEARLEIVYCLAENRENFHWKAVNVTINQLEITVNNTCPDGFNCKIRKYFFFQ